MNTFLLIYAFNGPMSPRLQRVVLEEATEFFEKRGFQCQRGSTVADILEVTGSWQRFSDPGPINTLFGYCNVGLALRRIKVTFSDVLMAMPHDKSHPSFSDYRNEGFTLFRSDGKRIDCYCDSNNRTVEIDTKIDYSTEELEIARLGMLDATERVLKVSKATKAAVQLIKAQRTTPGNGGFVARSTKELFEAIGDSF